MVFGRSPALLFMAALAATFFPLSPSQAGVVDGVRTVDDLVVYLGVVPAAVIRAWSGSHR